MKRLIYPLVLALGVAVCGGIVRYSYVLNLPLFFYDGLFGALALLWLARLRWRASVALKAVANPLILLILLLPVADAFLALEDAWKRSQLRPARVSEKSFSYEAARGNPAQFAIWWGRFLEEWDQLSKQILIRDPDRRLPYRLKPGSSGTFFRGQIKINRLGFRDREFDVEKKDHYRIVAIGESTTMGMTLTEHGQPWPKKLEELIRNNFDCAHPVQVINAGVAGYNLRDSLIRLKRDVLPLKPDLILCYHGYNGFQFMDDTMGEDEKVARNAVAPVFVARPSRLLARVEYRVKMLSFRRKYFHSRPSSKTLAERKALILGSYYARLYRELIDIARTNRIPLVLLSHNLAVNSQSPRNVVDFYRGGFPDVRYRIEANQLQTYLLKKLAGQFDGVWFVDTSDGLDGQYEKFFDLVHLTQAGKDRLAENIFNGIQERLGRNGQSRTIASARSTGACLTR